MLNIYYFFILVKMNIIIKLIIYTNIIKLSNNDLIIPLQFLNINITNDEIYKNFLLRLYSSYLYMNITIGSNKEIIKGILNMEQIGFFIYENAYNYNSSSTFSKKNKTKSFYKRNNEEGYISNDTICLYNIKDINNPKIEKCKNMNKVTFSLMKSRQNNIKQNIYENYSIIGLQQNEYSDELSMPLFINTLKKSKIIESYFFSFQFKIEDINNGIDAYLLLRNETKINENIETKIFSTKRKFGFPFWGINFDAINVGLNNSYDRTTQNELQFFYHKEVELVPTLPYILGIYDYHMHIKYHFFYHLLKENICKFESIPINPDYGTYVCDSKSKLFIETYNNKFPKLFFIHIDSNTTFILDKEDLFTYNPYNKSDTQIYFLVLFYNNIEQYDLITKFKLGIPFFKKYKFSFNSDAKIITYYEKPIINKENKLNLNNKEKLKILFKIIFIIVLFIICFVLGVLYHKNIIKLPRKKLANELDDDYEYKTHSILSNNRDNLYNNYDINKVNINNNVKNIEFQIKN